MTSSMWTLSTAVLYRSLTSSTRVSSCRGYPRHSPITRGAKTTTFNDVMLTRSDDVNYCVTEHHAWLCSTCTVVGLAGYSGACPAPWAVDIMPRNSVTAGQGGTVINCTLPVCPLVPSITQDRKDPQSPKLA